VYLCPLDLADDFSAVRFGPNSVRKLTAAELNALVDPCRLKRFNPKWMFDVELFSEFVWLVVEENCPLDRDPDARAVPWLFATYSGDWGRIEPHKERFPTAVEAALFALLRVRWEDWVKYPDVSWCGFQVPWIYTLSDDIFVQPQAPPSPYTLSWDPDLYSDADGNVVFGTAKPERVDLKPAAIIEVPNWLNDEVWSELVSAHQSPLFETPIAHFLVRAFLAEGVDEFLAHLFTIEAALGLWKEPKIPRLKKQPSATDRMVARVSALLGEEVAGNHYRHLFNLRSEFVHGRKMEAIRGKERVVARRLANRVVNGIIEATLNNPGPQSREDYLGDLLARGLPYLRE
jgi:hypothetical protein